MQVRQPSGIQASVVRAENDLTLTIDDGFRSALGLRGSENMNSAIERLLTLRVKDVMRRDVVTVPRGATMAQAASLLDENEITGLPVVDEAGACVGMLSSSDFVHKEMSVAVQSPTAALRFENTYVNKSFTIPELIEGNLVAAHMSPVVRTVGNETPILNAARILCDEHIHRLVVINEYNHPVGILSALDIVACMVAAIEE